MADSDAAEMPLNAGDPGTPVHDRAVRLLAGSGAEPPQARGGAVVALAEPVDRGDPPTVERAAGGCGGGRRVMLSGRAVVRSDGVRPTHLLVRSAGSGGGEVLVLVERGDRGVGPWPADGTTAGEVGFDAVRLDGSRVVSGTPA